MSAIRCGICVRKQCNCTNTGRDQQLTLLKKKLSDPWSFRKTPLKTERLRKEKFTIKLRVIGINLASNNTRKHSMVRNK